MGVDALVVRTEASGGPALVAQHVACPVINAGDGRHEHPTQGLLDALTLRQVLGGLTGQRVAIVGDILHSRVARSNAHGLTALGADVVLVGPPALVPADFARIVDAGRPGAGTLSVSHDLDATLPQVDAVMMLRVQFERGTAVAGDYREQYGLTEARAGRLRPGLPIMHPGPMNRGIEIDSAVADDPGRSVILRQVTNGVAVRMAVLERAAG
jgi:aspartate carbamoyltransferase catalytic subunit